MTVTQLLGATGTGSIVERFTFDWSDLVGTADTTKTVIMKALPKAAIIEWVRIKHSVYFRGGSISTFTVSVGCMLLMLQLFRPRLASIRSTPSWPWPW